MKTKKITEEKKFPCHCGQTFATAVEFSDHVHTDCELGVIPWRPSADYLASRAARGN
jgi:hypothetical protein